jgi:hypothetical protein
LILASNSSYSQRIRTIGTDTFVTFTREQAKAINDTFVAQRTTILDLRTRDSINDIHTAYLIQQDSTRYKRDSVVYYNEILPVLIEIKRLLNLYEDAFKTNIEVGVGGGLSTYFGTYRQFNSILNGKYYIPSANIHAKLNLTKHFTARFEHSITQTAYSPKFIDNNIVNSTVLFDYNIAANYYSVRVGMIPTVSVGFNMFGLDNGSPVIGAGIKGYFTANTSLEINMRYIKTNLDYVDDLDHFIWGHITLTRKIK